MFSRLSTSRAFSILLIIIITLALLLGSAALPINVRAFVNTITVTTSADNTVHDSLCSLREAITNANDNAVTYTECLFGTGGLVIAFSSGLDTDTITLGSSLTVTDTNPLTISGGGRITISGANTVRVFYINAGVPLILDNLTVANGYAFSAGNGGGGAYNLGALTIDNSTFSGNSGWSYGGGVNNLGTLVITNSTFSGNSQVSYGSGGGVHNQGTATITNSTFTGNSSDDNGGGVENESNHTLTITNSTFSDNRGVYPDGGGGIKNWGVLNLYNSIVANSTIGGDCVNNGGVVTANNNLIEDASNACGLANGINGNIVGSDPNLGGLVSSPAYFSLNSGSPALNAGNNTICAAAPVNNTSQNGVTRPQDVTCDIGSFERDNNLPTVVSSLRTNPDPTNVASVHFAVTFSEPVSGVDTTDFTLTTTGSITGASIASVSGAGATRSVGVNTGSGNGTIRLNVIDDDTILDAALNPLGGLGAGNGYFTFGQSYTIDKTVPTVAMSSLASDPTSTSPIPVSVTFSESVNGFTSTDIVPTNGAVSNFAGSGASYTFDLTPAGQGLVKADIAVGVAIDIAGNGNTIAAQFSRTFDTVAPTVLSSLRADTNPTSAASLHFTITFSEPVSGVDPGDFGLTMTGGLSDASVTAVTGSPTIYNVTVNTGSGDGSIRLDVVDNDSIVDAASNPLGGTGAGNGNFMIGETYTITGTRVYNLYLPILLR